ncbi:MAG: hypothetical protein WCA46_22265 [Actinocatenispora sp.]
MTVIVPGDVVLIGTHRVQVARAEWLNGRTVEITRADGRVLRVRADLVQLTTEQSA